MVLLGFATVVAEKAAVTPAGRLPIQTVTGVVKPLSGVTTAVNCAVLPTTATTAAGLNDSVNVGVEMAR